MDQKQLSELYQFFLQSTGVTTDTRKIQQDNLFFALKGPSFNGNDFAPRALALGSKKAVVDEYREEFEGNKDIIIVKDALEALQNLARYHRNHLKIPIIGLTGSNGKTTTKELMKAALSQRYKTFATHGNLNNHIGVPLSLLSIKNEHEIGIIEMGANHQKEIEFLCSICRPDYGLITNIGLAHLEGFGGEEGIYKGKKELFDSLIANRGTVFVNIDDHKVVRAANEISFIGYGNSEKALYQGKAVLDKDSLSVIWWRKDRPEEKHTVKSNLTGKYNFSNIMAAIAVSRYFGVSEKEIANGIQGYLPSNQRSQTIHSEKANTIIADCYNANPNSMKAALENIAVWDHGQKVLILGDMLELGENAILEHQKIIRQIKEINCEKVFLVGELFREALHQFPDLSFESLIETSEVASTLSNSPITNSLVLLKGSRKKKLETLLELL